MHLCIARKVVEDAFDMISGRASDQLTPMLITFTARKWVHFLLESLSLEECKHTKRGIIYSSRIPSRKALPVSMGTNGRSLYRSGPISDWAGCRCRPTSVSALASCICLRINLNDFFVLQPTGAPQVPFWLRI